MHAQIDVCICVEINAVALVCYKLITFHRILAYYYLIIFKALACFVCQQSDKHIARNARCECIIKTNELNGSLCVLLIFTNCFDWKRQSAHWLCCWFHNLCWWRCTCHFALLMIYQQECQWALCFLMIYQHNSKATLHF